MLHRADERTLATVVLRAWLAVVLFAWLAWPATARAETQQCIVLDTLPVTILSPGNWCLESNFDQDFPSFAIIIASDGVVLDCNGRRLRHTGAASTSNRGVSQGVQRTGVVVRNCVVENFAVGIELSTNTSAGNRGSTIENNTVLRFGVEGIKVWGSGNRIEGNRVSQALGTQGLMVGIGVASSDGLGAGNVIRGNTISEFRPTTAMPANVTWGINLTNVRNTQIVDNVLTHLAARTGQCTFAINGGYESTGTSIEGNVILHAAPASSPLDGGQCYGIYMPGSTEQMNSNVCRDNVVGHFNTNIYGCVSSANTSF